MTLIACWVLFPVVLLVLALGCGLLAERLGEAPLPGELLAPVGLAAVVVIAGFFTLADATAELATPAVLAAALAGYVLGDRRRLRHPSLPALALAVGVFLAYGSPVLLSGDPTIAGFIKLDDASTWMALTDHAMTEGRSHEGLTPSTHEAAVSIYLDSGYPLGSFLPWGVGQALSGQDLAWLFQPYEAFIAAMLALALYALALPLVRRAPVAAAVAFVAAQPALLYGYALWGGVKEVMAAALIALVAALALSARAWLALAVASAALITTLSVGGGAWIAVALAAFVVSSRAVRPIARFALALGLLAIPALTTAATFIDTASGLDSSVTERADRLGNLLRPLDTWQVFGIWPAGDFRVDPGSGVVTALLIGTAIAAAGYALAVAARRGAFGLLLYAATAVAGLAVVAIYGSPWVDAKGLATASPALLLAAAGGAALLVERGRPVAGALAALAIGGGVLWSNALAYHEVNLAPYDQMRELEAIGERYAGDGPALISEYHPYAARHLLRELDAEAPSELRRRTLPTLGSPAGVPKGGFEDIDQFAAETLEPYRLLVLRSSPTASRPPSVYDLAWSGRWYEVWRRRADRPAPVERLPLGTGIDPTERAGCSAVERLAARAGPGGRLATVLRQRPVVVATPLVPGERGAATHTVRVPAPGRYAVWVGGSFRSRMEVLVDGRRVGELSGQLNNAGGYSRFGVADLTAGSHSVELRYAGPTLAPGSAGPPYALGPIALATHTAPARVSYFRAAEHERLCGSDADWIEAIPAVGG